ncbi:MAG: hypothetical protein H7843_09245 [Nitrospirota bacterium]
MVKEDTWVIVMIVSTLIMVCLIFGLTLVYAEPKRVISADQQVVVMQKHQRKQDIKAEIADYDTISQQIDSVKNMEDVKVILRKLAKVAALQSDGE